MFGAPWIDTTKKYKDEIKEQIRHMGDVLTPKPRGEFAGFPGLTIADFSREVSSTSKNTDTIMDLKKMDISDSLGSVGDVKNSDVISSISDGIDGHKVRTVGKGGSQADVRYGELDSLGRTTGIEATITQDMIGTGTSARPSIKPAGFEGQKSGHARGHLLGNQLGGSGDDVRNLVTIYQNPVNHPVMSKIEGTVRNAVENGQIVNYSVTPIYKGNSLIPSGITIKANGSGDLNIFETILNRK